jgi:hypothetical protein
LSNNEKGKVKLIRSGLKKQLESLSPGDLICCEWCNASVGKSSGSGQTIDVPVKSWGVYVGLFGEKTKHVVIAQNSFRYADGLFDLDYTAIPISWTIEVSVIVKEYLLRNVADKLANSFLMGRRRAFNHQRTFQRRLSMHGRPD